MGKPYAEKRMILHPLFNLKYFLNHQIREMLLIQIYFRLCINAVIFQKIMYQKLFFFLELILVFYEYQLLIQQISLQPMCSCLTAIGRTVIFALVSYSSFISTLFGLIIKSNPPAEGFDKQFQAYLYIFIGANYALDISKKIVIIFVSSFGFRFKFDMFTNIAKFLVQIILGLNLMMNTHNTPFIYTVSFIFIIVLILVRLFYICYIPCRLSKKIRLADYEDDQFVTYKLSLTNSKQIKRLLKLQKQPLMGRNISSIMSE